MVHSLVSLQESKWFSEYMYFIILSGKKISELCFNLSGVAYSRHIVQLYSYHSMTNYVQKRLEVNQISLLCCLKLF